MKYLLIFIFSVFMLSARTVVFADTALKAEVDKTALTTDDVLTYKLTLSSTEKNIPPVKIPGFKGFAIVSQAQSSSFSFQQGKQQTVMVFAFTLLPRETGKLKIEPAQVTVLGKVYSSQACQVEVKQGASASAESAPQEEPGPKIPDSGQPQYNI
jgi:hypothetical protein